MNSYVERIERQERSPTIVFNGRSLPFRGAKISLGITTSQEEVTVGRNSNTRKCRSQVIKAFLREANGRGRAVKGLKDDAIEGRG